MTDEMYAKLRKPSQTPRRDRPLWRSVLFAAVLSLLLILPVGYAAWYGFHWHAHTAAVSESTKHAYYFGGLQGTVDGQPVTLTADHTYDLYEILTRSMSKLQREAPAAEPDIRLEYGDGAMLEVWQVTLDEADAVKNGYGGTRKTEGVFWRFTNYEGRVWMYDTDKLRYHDLWIVAAPQQNQP